MLSSNLSAVAGLCEYKEPFVTACVEHARALAPYMSLRGAATILWALGRLRHHDDVLLQHLAVTVADHVEALERQDSVEAVLRSGEPQQMDEAPHVARAPPTPPAVVVTAAREEARQRGGVLAEVASQPRRQSTEWQVEDSAAADGPEVVANGRLLSMALHACATLGAACLPEAQHMARCTLRYTARHRRALSAQSLVNAAWAAAVLGLHTERAAIGPILLEALVRSPELCKEELAQLAQVDVALTLEAPWYTGSEWLQDGNHYELLHGLFHLGANRCGALQCALGGLPCAGEHLR